MLTIAIHGVGNHKPGDIKRSFDKNLAGTSGLDFDTFELNWDTLARHSASLSADDVLWFLERTANSISVASRVGLRLGANSFDTTLGSLQAELNRLTQWWVATLAAIAAVMPAVQLAVLTPAAWLGLRTQTLDLVRFMGSLAQVLILGICAGSALLLALGGLRVAATLSLRPITVTVRSLALLLTQPLLVLISGAFMMNVTVLWFVVVVFGASLYLLAGWKMFVATISALVGLLVMRLFMARLWFEGPIKVALDIFRYLGEPEYRDRIQGALDASIDGSRDQPGSDGRIALVGHSLGTVIALDSLLHSASWRPTDRILLLTMGSPVRRYFLRFFPRILFPEGVGAIAGGIAHRVAEFRWVNIYRPWDYVGTALGLGGGNDVSTGQHARVLRSHTDYWSDGAVRDSFTRALARLEPVHRDESPPGGMGYELPDPPKRAAHEQALTRAGGALGCLTALGIFGGMLFWVSTGLDVRGAASQSRLGLLSSNGVLAEAAVTHHRMTEQGGEDTTYIHHWLFEFTDSTGAPRSIPVELDVSGVFHDVRLRFDDRTLTDYVRADCTFTREPRWWEISRIKIPCKRGGIRVRYLPQNPETFDLPDFPPQERAKDRAVGWFKVVFLSGVLTVFAMLPVGVAFALFLLLLGYSVNPPKGESSAAKPRSS